MKLDVSNLRYMTKDDFRVLTAIEMGMRNHEIVPVELIGSIAGLRHGGVHKTLSTLLKFKLVAHDRRFFDGYRLTYPGYDYLALKALLQRNSLSAIGRQIGVGKESDIFLATDENDDDLVIKLQRLGRVSFRNIKTKRDYLQHRKNASWLYMSRLGALKEFAFMKALHAAGFPTPRPVDCSRHCVVMSRVPGKVLCQIKVLRNPAHVYQQCMDNIIRLAKCGLIHCDFNEFNLMVSDDEEENLTIIDFPQMVSINHANGQMLFDRDVECIVRYFAKKYNFSSDYVPQFEEWGERDQHLDVEVEASGFSEEQAAEFDKLRIEQDKMSVDSNSDNDEINTDDEDNDAADVTEESEIHGEDSAAEDNAAGDTAAASASDTDRLLEDQEALKTQRAPVGTRRRADGRRISRKKPTAKCRAPKVPAEEDIRSRVKAQMNRQNRSQKTKMHSRQRIKAEQKKDMERSARAGW